MRGNLSASRIGSETVRCSLLMLHGIYGRGRNWQTIARAVVAGRPDYACWLIDLPHHGESSAGSHGDTVKGLAADIADWCRAGALTPAAILGHSYGGKVALAYAHQHRESPLQVWVIDSTPDVKPPSGSAWGMLEAIRRLPPRFATRDDAIQGLVREGYSAAVAQWMASNLARGDAGLEWKIDLDAMERLLRDFFVTDLWHVIDQPAPHHEIHVLKATESSVLSPSAVARIERADPAHVKLHQRVGGHWIHAESPQLVAELLIAHLPAESRGREPRAPIADG